MVERIPGQTFTPRLPEEMSLEPCDGLDLRVASHLLQACRRQGDMQINCHVGPHEVVVIRSDDLVDVPQQRIDASARTMVTAQKVRIVATPETFTCPQD